MFDQLSPAEQWQSSAEYSIAWRTAARPLKKLLPNSVYQCARTKRVVIAQQYLEYFELSHFSVYRQIKVSRSTCYLTVLYRQIISYLTVRYRQITSTIYKTFTSQNPLMYLHRFLYLVSKSIQSLCLLTVCHNQKSFIQSLKFDVNN